MLSAQPRGGKQIWSCCQCGANHDRKKITCDAKHSSKHGAAGGFGFNLSGGKGSSICSHGRKSCCQASWRK